MRRGAVVKAPAPDVTHLLRTIEQARARMAPLKGVDLACAAVHEMEKIIIAFDAYQDAVTLRATLDTSDRVLDAIFGQQPPRGGA
jgi:hypothetical protein